MKKKKPTGPKPYRLKVDGDWDDAMKSAVKKKKPPEGWPKPDEQGTPVKSKD